MKRMTWLILIAAAAASGCTRATPEQQIINDAAAALGGRDKILAVKSLVIEGEGTNGNLGQDMTPEPGTLSASWTSRPQTGWCSPWRSTARPSCRPASCR